MLQSELRFLEAELGIGFTSCRIAVQAKSNQKRERNLANARKAYDAIVYFRPKTELSSADTDRIDSQLAKLKAELRQLGEEL
jgi:hypothetical protein